MKCTLCDSVTGANNIAVFACGHTFHLSCIFLRPHNTLCSTCSMPPIDLMADLGGDRRIAMSAGTSAKIQSRMLQPQQQQNLMQRVLGIVSPLTPKAHSFCEHVGHNNKLSVISTLGFGPDNAVQERIQWSKIHKQYSSSDILEFGFRWEHMVKMGIVPEHLRAFDWHQLQQVLRLDAQKILQIRMSISELAKLRYNPHKLIEMGFDWNVLHTMGANVETWSHFKFSLTDIKRYWTPSIAQLVSSGFYDKERLTRSGWPMDEVLEVLPPATERCSGRILRLAF